MNDLPDIHFGSAAAWKINWRGEPDDDGDDDELAETPPDVVAMLGFDPAEEVAEPEHKVTQASDGWRGMANDKAIGPFLSRELALRAVELAVGKVPPGLAYDKTARTLDVDGRMHVEGVVLTKACVSSYRGSEIPGFDALGLKPDEIYRLLRDPAELKLAVNSFDGIPLMIQHIEVNAEDHQPDKVVGATGTNAKFDGTTLTNDIVIWAQDAIDGVEDGSQMALSCGYRYVPVMEAGMFNGEPYSGKMTQIVANHLALVEKPRVPGAMVLDRALDDSAWGVIEEALLDLVQA